MKAIATAQSRRNERSRMQTDHAGISVPGRAGASVRRSLLHRRWTSRRFQPSRMGCR